MCSSCCTFSTFLSPYLTFLSSPSHALTKDKHHQQQNNLLVEIARLLIQLQQDDKLSQIACIYFTETIRQNINMIYYYTSKRNNSICSFPVQPGYITYGPAKLFVFQEDPAFSSTKPECCYL